MNSCYFSKFFISNTFLFLTFPIISLYFIKKIAFKYSILNFSLTNHFLLNKKIKTFQRKREGKKVRISYKIRGKSISSKMFIVSNFSSTVNPFSMIMERWTSSFELTRNNYEIIRGYHGVNEFITRSFAICTGFDSRDAWKKKKEKERDDDGSVARQHSGGPLFAIRATSFRSYR